MISHKNRNPKKGQLEIYLPPREVIHFIICKHEKYCIQVLQMKKNYRIMKAISKIRTISSLPHSFTYTKTSVMRLYLCVSSSVRVCFYYVEDCLSMYLCLCAHLPINISVSIVSWGQDPEGGNTVVYKKVWLSS